MTKKPKAAIKVESRKQPTYTPFPKNEQFFLDFRYFDKDFDLSKHKLSNESNNKKQCSLCVLEIFDKLGNFQRQRWSEIRKDSKKNHYNEIISLASEAQKRFKNYFKNFSDEEVLFSIHLSGKQRFYGLVRGNIYYVLWWDPLHLVYPTKRIREN